jgi:hypothetical protein
VSPSASLCALLLLKRIGFSLFRMYVNSMKKSPNILLAWLLSPSHPARYDLTPSPRRPYTHFR